MSIYNMKGGGVMDEECKDIKLRPMMKISEMVPYLKTKNIKF